MHRSILGLMVALVLAAGVCTLGPAGESVAYGKGRTASKSTQSKKKTVKSSGRSATKKSASRSTGRASARAGKRGKNASSNRVSRKAGRRERRPAQKSVARAQAKTPVRDDVNEDGETPASRPANRLVAEIAQGRVVEIQNALIKAGAFVGPATGVYDQATFEAMTSFQSRRGLGATGMPTAEALKALGVRKNSGIGITTPAVVVQSTAPSASATPSYVHGSPPNP
jgi:hypothetical protein